MFKIILLTVITLFSVVARHNQVKVIRPPTCNIKRPCPKFDIKCIQKEFIKRNWFGHNVGNQPEGPLILNGTVKYSLPYTKVTVYGKDCIITGLEKGKVTEFYINEDTNKAVLSCMYCDLVAKSTAVMHVHRAGQESIQVKTSGAYEHYTNVRTTTIITGLNGPPDMATHFDECKMKKFSYGKGEENIKDKDVKRIFKAILKDIDIGIKEANIQRTKAFQDYFINNVIGKGICPPDEKASPVVPPTAYAFATATTGVY